jgi:L-lactate dehydrogenase complex protein LldE
MVRHQYPRLLAEDPRWGHRARRVAARIYEFSEYLVDVLAVDTVGARYDGTLTCHESCYLLHNLNVSRRPLLRLRRHLRH